MPLTCECPDYDGDGWFFLARQDMAPLKTSRRQRCRSCVKLIDIDADCLEFFRWREPITDIEEKIFGEGGEIRLGNYYLCEPCGGLFWALEELGFCVTPAENMRELVKEYNAVYHPERKGAVYSDNPMTTGI